MKRFLIPIALATAATLSAQTPPPAPAIESVTVTGTGRTSVAPDRFSFTVGVQTVANTVDVAVRENNTRTAAVIAALKGAGATDKDIQTSNFAIWPQQNYEEGKPPRILGYQVTNNVTVRSTKIADAGRLLGIAVNAGVNTASGLNFEVSNPATGREQGLRAAFDDARAKAMLLAQAAGRTLGRAVVINESSGQPVPPPYPMARTMAMEAKVVGDVPVAAGEQENVYSVTVSFELR